MSPEKVTENEAAVRTKVNAYLADELVLWLKHRAVAERTTATAIVERALRSERERIERKSSSSEAA